MERAKQISESIELGVLLALAGGFMDAYSYIARDGVFANAQTGNILLVGINLSEGDLMRAGRYFFPVLAFALGIMLADLIHERFSSLFHWRQLTVFLEAAILLGVSFIPGTANLVANCLTSFARSALQSVDDYIITHKKGFLENGLLYFGVILTFVCGAVLGNLCIGWIGLHAIAVASALLAVCFLIMFIDREGKVKGVQRLG